MRIHFVAILICLAGSAIARAQTVQLPTIHYFAWEGSVLVPDQGETASSGLIRGRVGRDEFGAPLLPRHSALGSERGAVGASVSAFVHDFPAVDESRLGLPAGSSKPLHQVSRSPAQAAVDKPLPSVAELRRQQSLEAVAGQKEALEWFRRGQVAQAGGKPEIAQIYYRMAARRATGKLAEEVRAAAGCGATQRGEGR